MAATTRSLIGRDVEVEAVVGALAPDLLPAAAVIHGEAGIGKTSLWHAAVADLAAAGYRVLSTRAAEPETGYSYAALADLLDGVAEALLPALPPVQRRALEAALLLGDAEGQADERAVAAAFRGALRLLAAESPVVVALDDLQWLDAASLSALRFALPRLDGLAITMLATVRGTPPPWLRELPVGPRVTSVELTGLSVGALRELLRTRLDLALPRPILLRLWETSAGNPFFALELAEALRRAGPEPEPGGPLPIPATLDGLLQERLDALGPEALAVVTVAAVAGEATPFLIEQLVGDRAEAGVDGAVAGRILELHGERLRFTHPLLATAAASRQTPTARRELHARLALAVPVAEERARHLALASLEPDSAVAARLEEAARSADARGAPGAAAELAEHALRLTPGADVDDALRRRLLAADRLVTAGDVERAVALLEHGRESALAGPARAALLLPLADIAASEPRRAEALFLEALDEAGDDDALVAATQLGLAAQMRWDAGVERGAAHAGLAVEAATRAGDPALLSRALAYRASWEFRAGRGLAHETLAEAVALERTTPVWPMVWGATEILVMELVWAVELDAARELLLELLDVARALHDPRREAEAIWILALCEFRAGDWQAAEAYAADSLELKRQLGEDATDDYPSALVAAHRGRVDDAQRLATRAAARGAESGVQIEESGHEAVLGFVELSLGDAAAALPHLRRSYELRDAFMRDPGMRLELGDLLEAHVAVGALDEAEEILERWEPVAAAVDRAWARAILARGRALLLAARGDLDEAFARFDEALAQHERSRDPFERARTLLALGRTQRRAKRRAAARATLGDALAAFEELGAPLWADQAQGEVARIGGRAAARDDELTEAERRIAALVAGGSTNKQVAATLFLTEHTVETALTRIYRKLGVRSRTELARRLAADD